VTPSYCRSSSCMHFRCFTVHVVRVQWVGSLSYLLPLPELTDIRELNHNDTHTFFEETQAELAPTLELSLVGFSLRECIVFIALNCGYRCCLVCKRIIPLYFATMRTATLCSMSFLLASAVQAHTLYVGLIDFIYMHIVDRPIKHLLHGSRSQCGS